MSNELYIKRIGYHYDFFSDRALKHLEFSFSQKHKIFKETIGELLDTNGLSICFIKKKFKVIDFNDYLELHYKNKVYAINEISKIENHWQINVDDSVYSFYSTKGSRYSIYKNSIQISGVLKNKMDYFNKSILLFKTDDADSIVFQMALFLAANFETSSDGAALTINIDSPFYRSSDEKWFSSRFKKT